MIRPAAPDAYLTPPVVARRYGVSVDKVLAWIHRGELAALNLADRLGGRPRWRISPEALAAFERSRSATPPPAQAPRRNSRQTAEVQHFFR